MSVFLLFLAFIGGAFGGYYRGRRIEMREWFKAMPVDVPEGSPDYQAGYFKCADEIVRRIAL